MRRRIAIFAVFAAFFLVLSLNPVTGAVDTKAIDAVLNKAVLDSRDRQIIDDFVAQAVAELVKTRDFTSVSLARSVILRKRSKQPQYAAQFSSSARKYISSGFEQALELNSESRQFRIMLNLLILIDGLEDLQLVDLAIERLNDANTSICYWAVHSITNAGITEQLSSDPAANMKLAVRIAQALEKLVDRCSPETLPMMVEFAGAVKVSQAEKLLLRITDMRIKKYAEWSVEKELMDAAILRALFNKISSGRAGESTVARRFAQLYSYAIQRYYIGQDFLSESQKQHLISILVETESSYISKLLGEPPQLAVRIRRAIERNDYAALLLEHNRLLGDKTRAGQLGLKLKFDYGQNSDGTKRIEPLALSKPPSTIGK